MSLKIAMAYRTTSNEALCVLTGITPIVIKAEEIAKLYLVTRHRQNHQLDHNVELKNWTHLADLVIISMRNERNAQFKFSQMEARTNMESDRESLYTFRIN